MSHLKSSATSSVNSSISSFRPTFISPRRRTTLTQSTSYRRLSTATLYQSSKFSLEECVSQIETILDDPEISTLLNSSQSEAIGSLREQINQCQHFYIPQENARGSTIPAKVLENAGSSANYGFLASTYGGLRLSDSTGNLEKIRTDASPLELVDHTCYVPPEWEKLSVSTKVKLATTLSVSNLDRWDFNILDVSKSVDPGSVLVLVGWAIIASPDAQKVMMSSIGEEYEEGDWNGYKFSSSLGIDCVTMVSFLRSLELQYDVNGKYHTNIHAADVTQTLHSMIRMGFSGLSSSMASLDIYSMLLAAAAHDVGHPGTNNMYQINAQTNLAILYNDKSPLENMHASKSSQLIKQLGLLDNFSSEQQTHVRSRMISAILATDMAHHFNKVSHMEEFVSQFEGDAVNWYDYVDTDNFDAFQDVLNYMIHLADISNPTKMRSLALYWADCALSEFFAQGDLERGEKLPISPLCDRETTNLATSQRDFIRFVVLPSYKVLGRILPGVEAKVLPKIHENLEYWESQCLEN